MSPVSNLGAAAPKVYHFNYAKSEMLHQGAQNSLLNFNSILIFYCWTRIILILEAEWVNNDFFSILIFLGRYISVLKSNDSTVFKMKGSNLENIVDRIHPQFFLHQLENIPEEYYLRNAEEGRGNNNNEMFRILTINSE